MPVCVPCVYHVCTACEMSRRVTRGGDREGSCDSPQRYHNHVTASRDPIGPCRHIRACARARHKEGVPYTIHKGCALHLPGSLGSGFSQKTREPTHWKSVPRRLAVPVQHTVTYGHALEERAAALGGACATYGHVRPRTGRAYRGAWRDRGTRRESDSLAGKSPPDGLNARRRQWWGHPPQSV